ncbi:beta-ketoacyl-ACP synthase II [candidate division KSB1 bacterium]
MKRRVVITGMGAITPIGNNIEESWDSLKNGRSGIDKITRFDASDYTVKIAGELKDFKPEEYIDRKNLKKMDFFTQYAVCSAIQAVKDSGINFGDCDVERAGVIVGSGIGGMLTFENQNKVLIEKGPRRISPFFIPMLIPDIAPGHISIMYGLKGPNYAVISACATAVHAFGDAFRIIQRGEADVMVSGGAEAPVTPMGIGGFAALKALSTRNDEPEKASRPFDEKRDGFIVSEGAGILILESLEHAQKRNAKIYCEVGGIGMTADAYHLTAPDPEGDGAYRAMKNAILDAGMTIEDIDYINAHGTSTEYNDKIETYAIKRLFNQRAYDIPISSTKSMTGHMLGAAGGIEIIAAVLTIVNSIIPPTINYEFPDKDCDLDYTPNVAREKEVNVALNNGFGFGGHNACVLLKKFNGS